MSGTAAVSGMRRVAVAVAVVAVVVVAVAVAWRLRFPLELEWMEGGSLHQALRLNRGQALYPVPSADFVPFLYTPLYPVVLGVLGWVLPLGLVLGRVVSVLAWIAAGWALWRAAAVEGKPVPHRLAGVGLFASGYVFSFRWLDLARADTLFLALLAWALVVLRGSRGRPRAALLAGVLMAAAFWTKQTAFPFVVASGLLGLWVLPRQLWIYVAVIAVLAGGGILLGNALTDGWLWTYVYELHQTHAFNRERFTNKTWGMFLHAAPWLALLLATWAADGATRLLPSRRPAVMARMGAGLRAQRGGVYWGAIAAVALLVSALGYSTQWAEPNAFIPGVYFTALFIAVAMPARGVREIWSLTLVSAQIAFALLVEPHYHPIQTRGLAEGLADSYRWQDPGRTVPSRQQWKRAAALRAELAAEPEPVFASHRPWWNVISGGEGHAGSMGLHDIPQPHRRRVIATLRDRIREGTYRVVWVEGQPPAWLRMALRRGGFRLARRYTGAQRVQPLSGYMSEAGMVTPYRRPQLQYVRGR